VEEANKDEEDNEDEEDALRGDEDKAILEEDECPEEEKLCLSSPPSKVVLNGWNC